MLFIDGQFMIINMHGSLIAVSMSSLLVASGTLQVNTFGNDRIYFDLCMVTLMLSSLQFLGRARRNALGGL